MRRCLFQRSIRRGALASLLPLLLCLASRGRADTLPDPASAPPANPPLTLQACRQIALGNQPTIAATRASLQASLDRQAALQNLRVPSCLARDLPIRQKQSALGVTIAQAGIGQAEAETLHGVSVGYLGALYAAQQIRLTDDPESGIRRRLKDLQTLVNDLVSRKQRRDVTLPEHRELVMSFLHTLDGRVQEAQQGKLRALAALREAMGVGPDFVIVLPDRDLPCPRVKPQLNELIALALARRGEMIQSAAFAEVVCLEMDAQASSHRPTMRTFASGSDIHAKPIPSGDLGGVSFRPAIVGPDMPANLTGSRAARVQQAHDYHERAQALTAKTRNLIALEVEDLYRRWVDKTEKAINLEKAYREAWTFSEKIKVSFNKEERGSYPNVDEVLNAGLITTRLQLEWKEAHYQALLALAALERATGEGFVVDFDAAPACEGEGKDSPHNANGKD
ncbi:MAG TPA: TolC family protein [Gemmataceae bacterium]|nr:TolC family protein [Gemmataceae bacterium]